MITVFLKKFLSSFPFKKSEKKETEDLKKLIKQNETLLRLTKKEVKKAKILLKSVRKTTNFLIIFCISIAISIYSNGVLSAKEQEEKSILNCEKQLKQVLKDKINLLEKLESALENNNSYLKQTEKPLVEFLIGFGLVKKFTLAIDDFQGQILFLSNFPQKAFAVSIGISPEDISINILIKIAEHS